MLKRNERIERLINRKLDGELTEDEQLELDRALIRSPEDRGLLEELLHIDSLCGAAVRDGCCADGGDAGFSTEVPRIGTVRPRRKRTWWVMPGALAACLGWLVVGGLVSDSGDRLGLTVDSSSPIEAPELTGFPELTATRPIDAGGFRRVGTGEGLTNGRRDTGVYGAVGDDGKVYLIEVDRFRAVRRPVNQKRVRVPLGDL